MMNIIKFFETKEKIFILISLYFIVYFQNFTETFNIQTFSMSERIVVTYTFDYKTSCSEIVIGNRCFGHVNIGIF